MGIESWSSSLPLSDKFDRLKAEINNANMEQIGKMLYGEFGKKNEKELWGKEGIRALQRALGVSDDGFFWPDTFHALVTVQKEKWIQENAFVGPKTQTYLWLEKWKDGVVRNTGINNYFTDRIAKVEKNMKKLWHITRYYKIIEDFKVSLSKLQGDDYRDAQLNKTWREIKQVMSHASSEDERNVQMFQWNRHKKLDQAIGEFTTARNNIKKVIPPNTDTWVYDLLYEQVCEQAKKLSLSWRKEWMPPRDKAVVFLSEMKDLVVENINSLLEQTPIMQTIAMYRDAQNVFEDNEKIVSLLMSGDRKAVTAIISNTFSSHWQNIIALSQKNILDEFRKRKIEIPPWFWWKFWDTIALIYREKFSVDSPLQPDEQIKIASRIYFSVITVIAWSAMLRKTPNTSARGWQSTTLTLRESELRKIEESVLNPRLMSTLTWPVNRIFDGHNDLILRLRDLRAILVGESLWTRDKIGSVQITIQLAKKIKKTLSNRHEIDKFNSLIWELEVEKKMLEQTMSWKAVWHTPVRKGWDMRKYMMTTGGWSEI